MATLANVADQAPVDIADRTDSEMFRWFEASTGGNGDGQLHRRQWSNPMGSAWVIKRSLRKLGLNNYQLAKLLGPFEQRYISYWIKGDKSPSAFFMTRLFKLWDWQEQGLNVAFFDKVDWLNCRPIFYKGREPEGWIA